MRISIVLLLGILGFSSCIAADSPVQESLTLDAALLAVLENNPVLLAGDYQARAAAARIRQAQQSTSVQVKLELENFAGSGDFSGDDLLETTLSLGKVLELGNKADLRGEVAHNEAALLENERDAERLDLLAEATRRFIHVVVDQERLKIARDKLPVAERTAVIVDDGVIPNRTSPVLVPRCSIYTRLNPLEPWYSCWSAIRIWHAMPASSVSPRHACNWSNHVAGWISNFQAVCAISI
jgi:cobalt-zinc-cadmium efflux system outer membrane protein